MPKPFPRVPTPSGKSRIFSLKFQDLESPGKSLWPWKLKFKVLESPGKISLKITWHWKLRISMTKFGQLILRKIVKIVATRCHILRLKWVKCTKFNFGQGYAPDPALGEFTALPQIPSLDLKGPTFKGREGEGDRGWEERKGIFSVYLSICGLWKGPGKFLMGVLESPGFFCQ